MYRNELEYKITKWNKGQLTIGECKLAASLLLGEIAISSLPKHNRKRIGRQLDNLRELIA